MKNWFTALLPLALIVMLPGLDAHAPSSFGFLAGTEIRTSVGTAELELPETVTVYLNAVKLGSDGGFLTADPILWYEGDEAAVVFAEREPEAGIDGPPDGYYIVNDTEESVDYPVAPDAEVILQIYDRTGLPEEIEIKADKMVTLQKFSGLFQHKDLLDLSQFPYHLTLKDGKVIRIIQQYVP